MTERRQKYAAEFKRDAVKLVTEQGYAIAEAVRNLGLNGNMLVAGSTNSRQRVKWRFRARVA